MMYDRFMVVGGAGFVGSHLVDLLARETTEKVVVVDNFFLGRMENLSEAGDITVYREDARHLTALENIVALEKPEIIFNAAVQPLAYSFLNPEGAYMTSVQIAHNLANLLRKRMYKTLIHISSSEVYGSALYVPMDENHPMYPTTPYGAGKAAADLLLLSYWNLFGLDISILRPFNIYGPRQNTGVYAAIIPITIQRLLEGKQPIIEGDGKQTRDLTYVADVVEATCKLVEARNCTLNIGQGKETSVNEIIQVICDVLGYDGEVEQRTPRPGDVRRHLADVSLAKKVLDYSPKVSLREGIELTVNWYKEGFPV